MGLFEGTGLLSHLPCEPSSSSLSLSLSLCAGDGRTSAVARSHSAVVVAASSPMTDTMPLGVASAAACIASPRALTIFSPSSKLHRRPPVSQFSSQRERENNGVTRGQGGALASTQTQRAPHGLAPSVARGVSPSQAPSTVPPQAQGEEGEGGLSLCVCVCVT